MLYIFFILVYVLSFLSSSLISSFFCCQEALPSYPLSGMVNRSGGKVRLTFKMENDQIWIGKRKRVNLVHMISRFHAGYIFLGTKERTEKIGMSSIKTVVNEPIEGHEEYHILVSRGVLYVTRIFVPSYTFCFRPLFIRESSWVLPKLRGTGFTGFLLSTSTQSKKPF